MGRYTIRLGELSRKDIERAGAKASNLGELVSAGFQVPDGFSLTTEAFQSFLDANSIDAEDAAEKVEAGAIPPDVAEALFAEARGAGRCSSGCPFVGGLRRPGRRLIRRAV
jgi:phosphoenolpyruvate synthase/pyruvate phosphate dikinase